MVVSSDATFASVLERELGKDFEIHAAATTVAASVLLDSYTYSCVVVDGTVPDLPIDKLTVPVVVAEPEGITVDSIRVIVEKVRRIV